MPSHLGHRLVRALRRLKAIGRARQDVGSCHPQRPGDPRRDEGERPDYLVEDEETWLQGGRRIVPPVID
ncbi:hypothetical protein NKH18_19525 [Streptomyces sp. M10(2022)]